MKLNEENKEIKSPVDRANKNSKNGMSGGPFAFVVLRQQYLINFTKTIDLLDSTIKLLDRHSLFAESRNSKANKFSHRNISVAEIFINLS